MISLIIPFLEKYVQPFSCEQNEYNIFKEICFSSTNPAQLS